MPGALFQSAPAAAALKLSSFGSTALPSRFTIFATLSLFCLAYAYST